MKITELADALEHRMDVLLAEFKVKAESIVELQKQNKLIRADLERRLFAMTEIATELSYAYHSINNKRKDIGKCFNDLVELGKLKEKAK